MKNKIDLSVALISYRHEPFIEDALKSIIEQKTNYKIEIVCADDCSPDNTLKIIKKYQKKYPEMIRILKREHNLGGADNTFDCCKNCKGKYIAILEGDDYWCDINKVQESLDFLENNEEYIAYSHLQQGVNEKKEKIVLLPRWVKKDCDVTYKDYLKNHNIAFTGTIFRNIYKDPKLLEDLKINKSFSKIIGDLQKTFYLTTKGKIRLVNKPMMHYRIFTQKKGVNVNSRYNIIELSIENIKILNRMNEFYHNQYSFKKIYAWHFNIGLVYGIINRKFLLVTNLFKITPFKNILYSALYMPVTCIKVLKR